MVKLIGEVEVTDAARVGNGYKLQNLATKQTAQKSTNIYWFLGWYICIFMDSKSCMDCL